MKYSYPILFIIILICLVLLFCKTKSWTAFILIVLTLLGGIYSTRYNFYQFLSSSNKVLFNTGLYIVVAITIMFVIRCMYRKQ